MVTPELIEYVKSERARGVTDEALRQALQTAGGWAFADIEAALKGGVSDVSVNNVSSIIQMTNDSHATKTDVPSITGPELKAWKLRRRHHIFFVLTAIVLIISAIFLSMENGAADLVYIPLIIIGICYLVSMFVAKFTKPGGNQTASIIVSILIAIVLTILLSGGLCTAFFMIAFSGF